MVFVHYVDKHLLSKLQCLKGWKTTSARLFWLSMSIVQAQQMIVINIERFSQQIVTREILVEPQISE